MRRTVGFAPASTTYERRQPANRRIQGWYIEQTKGDFLLETNSGGPLSDKSVRVYQAPSLMAVPSPLDWRPSVKLPKEQGAAPAAVKKSVASRKQSYTARLSVADVEGVEQQYIPLNLSMESGQSLSEIELRLTGLPETATLSAGEKLADGTWVVTAKDTGNLRVLAPDIEKPERHTVAVEVVDSKTGSLSAPTQEMLLSILPR